MSDEVFRFREGSGPLLVAMPHVGVATPTALAPRLTERALRCHDADWHVDRLYGFLDDTDASTLAAVNSRSVIDLNRAPDNAPLYPGRFETGLCPTETFDGEPLYLAGQTPDASEVDARRETWWRPYHERLAATLDATRERHGRAVLLDAHSIRAVVPKLFEGRLPDINVGTADGVSCDPALTAAVRQVLAGQDAFTWVIDGRFKGGWTTRWYGRPEARVHAIQIELAQSAYLDETTPEAFDPSRAAPLQALLKRIVAVLDAFGREGADAR